MKYKTVLTKGKLIKRYKRFLADVELESGEVVIAHCANSGSMLSLLDAQMPTVYLSANTNPKAKLDWRLELIEVSKTLVNVNTHSPNAIVEQAINEGIISELKGYDTLRREVKYASSSRIDILLESSSSFENDLKKTCYVEVKNVSLSRTNGLAEFPDSVSIRATKHLADLSLMKNLGNRAVMIYLISRSDCTKFTIAKDIDKVYFDSFIKATKAGVEAYAYMTKIDLSEIVITGKIEIEVN